MAILIKCNLKIDNIMLTLNSILINEFETFLSLLKKVLNGELTPNPLSYIDSIANNIKLKVLSLLNISYFQIKY